MRTFILVLLLTSQTAVLTGCTISDVNVGPKREIASYSEQSMKVEQPLELDLKSDSGNIEVYTWDKDEVKFEMAKRVRGIQKTAILEKRLKDFKVGIRKSNNKILFESNYKGPIKSPADRSLDLKIYIPKRARSMSYKLDVGNIKFFDDIKGMLRMELNMVNVRINRFEGIIYIKGNMGNVSIENGKIAGDSSILEDIGNIGVKSEFENNGKFSFETNIGNIDLMLPGDSKVSFENVGDVETSEFPAGLYPAKIKVYSGMGKISIKKY